VQPTERDIQERPDDARVELRPTVANEFCPGGLGGHGALVGTNGGHHLERISDSHDTGNKRDLLAGQVKGIARPVVVLVVGTHGVHTAFEKGAQRLHQSGALGGMAVQDGPLMRCRCAGLVEDFRGHQELADVMKKCTPTDLIRFGGRQPQLLGDQVGHCP
jgi:hypothetical protein